MKKFLILTVVASSLILASCHKKPAEAPSQAPSLEVKEQQSETPKTAPQPKPAPQEETPEISEQAAKDAIVGVWVLEGEECDSSTGISLAANGKYGSDDEGGTWTLNGYSLKVDAIADANADSEAKTASNEWVLKLRKIDDKQAILSRGDGSKVVWKRCPQVPEL